MYMCVHVHVYLHVYVSIYTCTCVYMYMCIHMYPHVSTCMYMYLLVSTCMYFPGEIVSCDVDIEVSVMHRSGKHWKWPNPVDKIFYRREDILQTITPPKVVRNRGQFTFDEVI